MGFLEAGQEIDVHLLEQVHNHNASRRKKVVNLGDSAGAIRARSNSSLASLFRPALNTLHNVLLSGHTPTLVWGCFAQPAMPD